MAQRIALATLAFLLSCRIISQDAPRPPDAATQATITAAMDLYQRAARSVNPDSIAAFFAPNGILFEPGIKPIVSRDSIRAFVASFPGVQVDSATVTADTIEVKEGMVLYWGSYFERLRFPGQPLSEQHGKFVAQWVRQADGSWLIQRLFRVPIPSPPS